MALTYTPAAELGSPCPEFRLPDLNGRAVSREAFKGRPLVVMFLCGHCPYVQAVEDRLIALAHEFTAKGTAFVAICANDSADYPEDSPAALKKRWQEKNYRFPYLIDEEQKVAKAFAAVCTPDLFLYDAGHRLRYRGRLDDSWRDASRVQRQELRAALEKVLAGESPSPEQSPAMGCSIKWKAPPR